MTEFLYLSFGAGVILCLWILRASYPHPYPRIPYNKHAAKRIMGDLPDLLEMGRKTKAPAKFVFGQCRKLGSPVVQIFIRPFTRPFIVIDDVREVGDIMANRTKEFDRAPSTIGFLKPFVPNSSIVKFTTPEFRTQRRLWMDVMTPDFLRRVAAPRMYNASQGLVELLRTRSAIADGRPFFVADDFELATLDAIWASLLGSDLKGVATEIAQIRSGAVAIKQPDSKDETAVMPDVSRENMYCAMKHFNSSIEKVLTSPMPKLHHWVLRHLPEFRRFWAIKCKTVDGLIKAARERFAQLDPEHLGENDDTCAMDYVLRRERSIVDNSTMLKSKPPTTQEIHDELSMFLIVGHDTTATTLSWAVKFLTNNQGAQKKLRETLHQTFSECTPNSPPTVQAILSADISYLDACLEEIHRVATIVPRLVRIATVDTEVLGYPIPKGAHVMCNTYVAEPPFDIPESIRSKKSQESKETVRSVWHGENMYDFYPERWLDDRGKFDGNALPKLAFSSGPRACFGKRLAIQELRIMMTMLIFSLHFEPIPDALNSPTGRERAIRVPEQCYVRVFAL